MPPKKTCAVADVRLVGARRRVDGQQRHVVAAGHELGGERVVAQAAAAVHAARARREMRGGAWRAGSGGAEPALQGAAHVEVLEQVALVRLVPAHLPGRQRAEVQPVQERRGEQRATAARLSLVMAVAASVGPERPSGISSAFTGTTAANGNRNSRLASG